ncbi:hypothetical protein IFM89_008300 [Coptis chinensis]|uniref:Uncharacterized protein n=1 Tax=Coptis chinensis TaxID=261450 RepID=A0A835ICS7_9MAGN|nr:hypothetical protein IFM89_008300 [Coptis chinensis]
MADVYAAECKAFTQICAVTTRSKARDKHQEHPTQDSPRNHEQDTDISPIMGTDSVAAKNKDSMKRSYDKKLHARAFKPGDWVSRTRKKSNEEPNNGKLDENWEGPFIIQRLTSKGS